MLSVALLPTSDDAFADALALEDGVLRFGGSSITPWNLMATDRLATDRRLRLT